MGRKTARTPRLTRREKMMQERLAAKAAAAPVAATPIQSPQMAQVTRLEALNPRQKTAIQLLKRGTPITFLTGSAGTGKSMIAAEHLASRFRAKTIEKAYLVRPAVGTGKSIGLLPGEIEEKMAPYFAQTVAHIETFLGKGFTKYLLDKKAIEMKPAEYIRGMSMENCVVIVEESQNFTHEEFEMMITRLGENCQMIFTGDQKQNDLRQDSGLKTTIALFNRMLQTHPEYLTSEDMDSLDEGVGIVQFTPDDVVRSGLTRAFVKVYYHND